MKNTGEPQCNRRRWIARGLGGLAAACSDLSVASVSASSRHSSVAPADVREALRKAVRFARQQLSVQGSYVFRWSADLKRREGEERVGPKTAWIQPPATPAVGAGFLEAYRLCREPCLLEAARETAGALIAGQLESGGWTEQIEFDPEARKRFRYRVDRRARGWNVTTLDDDKTQSCIRFLIRLDRTLAFRDRDVHECALYALDALLRAQYPNGAWPQRFSEPPDPRRFPVKRASYPHKWPRTWPGSKYSSYYTFNDDTIADVIRTLLDAADIYQNDRYRQAARKGGEFILLAQMPDPQPAWAQQYDADMHPAWARRFEPPAISGGESQGVIRVLLQLVRRTGERRFLEPVPRALEYLERSRLPTGQLARFYELRTNRPLYFTRDYRLTYRDDDLPTHYAFKVPARLDELRAAYRATAAHPTGTIERPATAPPERPRPTAALARRAAELVRSLDERGAWVQTGRLRTGGGRSEKVIEARTLVRNIVTLARFLAVVD